MATTAKSAAKGELDFDALRRPFDLAGLSIRHLAPDLTLNEVIPADHRGESKPWGEWQQYYEDLLAQKAIQDKDEWSTEDWNDYWEVRRLFGTTSLPRQVLQAAHKMLFGETTVAPTQAALLLISYALFTRDEHWNSHDSTLWCMYQQAQQLHANSQRKQESFARLLANLEA